MIKQIKKSQEMTCLEVIIANPIDEIRDITMYVAKIPQSEMFIFAIPHHHWAYQKNDDQEINLKYAPSGFNHPKYKSQLTIAMNKAIELFEGNHN